MAYGKGRGSWIGEEGVIRVRSAYRDGNIIHCKQLGECKVELGEDGPFPVTPQKGEVGEISFFLWGWWAWVWRGGRRAIIC